MRFFKTFLNLKPQKLVREVLIIDLTINNNILLFLIK
jgi:hypothetical protein